MPAPARQVGTLRGNNFMGRSIDAEAAAGNPADSVSIVRIPCMKWIDFHESRQRQDLKASE